MAIDTLKYAETLIESGIDEKLAYGQARAIGEFYRDRDTLKLSKALLSAGYPREQAEGLTEVINDIFKEKERIYS